MIKELVKTKNNELTLIISKDILGFGISINLKDEIWNRKTNLVIRVDFVCIRFWYVNFKKM